MQARCSPGSISSSKVRRATSRSEEHTSELQSHSDLHSFPTRRSSDLGRKVLMFEPGRSVVGNAGALLTRVNLIKQGSTRNFAVVDAAMNDLIRPTLYRAWMDVQPVAPRDGARVRYDVVGPICESGDWLARERDLAIAPGDLLAILGAGAYAMSMASNYNSRGRAAEVIVDRDRAYCVRERETVEDLYANESLLP